MTTQQDVVTNGIRLHVAEAGPADGPLVILLHGFPEYWYGWHRQIEYLASRGFRVWAPDQRGYDLSDKPRDVAAYRIDVLVEDIIGLLDAATVKKVGIVGHDWGGAVAWRLANRHPDRVERLVVLNVPPGQVLARRLLRDPRQLVRSWYIFFFQLPWLPEFFARLGHWWLVVRAMRSSSRPGTFTARDFDAYRGAWSVPGAYTAMINWYRAAWLPGPPLASGGRITVPTLLIWGEQDAFLVRALAAESIALCDDGRVEYIDATHWVHHEEPDRVNALLGEFLRPA